MTFQEVVDAISPESLSGREGLYDIISKFDKDSAGRSLRNISTMIKYPEQEELLSQFSIEKLLDVDNWTDEDFHNWSILILTI